MVSIDSSLRLFAKEKAREERARYTGVGVVFASEASKKKRETVYIFGKKKWLTNSLAPWPMEKRGIHFYPKMSTAPLFISVPTPYPVKSSVLRWRPNLSRFYPRIQRSNKNTRKLRTVNSLLSVTSSKYPQFPVPVPVLFPHRFSSPVSTLFVRNAWNYDSPFGHREKNGLRSYLRKPEFKKKTEKSKTKAQN